LDPDSPLLLDEDDDEESRPELRPLLPLLLREDPASSLRLPPLSRFLLEELRELSD
jgi:hypothetical protein